ncbi:MAG: succinate dehydrogenase, hydrophobic membrane anchor protein [Gammaproteobacteria bacterium]
MSLNTPLSVARGLGSAKEGAHHWKAQRLTAIALIPLSIWFICKITCLVGGSHADVISWIQQPWTPALLIVLLFSLFYHMALGLQVVIEDYVSTTWIKITLLLLTQFGSILIGLGSIVSVLRIAMGDQG